MILRLFVLPAAVLAGLAVAAPARAQSLVGRLLGQTTPQAVLRPDMAGKIRGLLVGRGIPPDVAEASLSALAAGLVAGAPATATMKGFAYAWSIAGGPLDSRNCRAVAGGWKRATSARSELTENGPWCWSAEGWIPVKNQFDGELSQAPAPAPVVPGRQAMANPDRPPQSALGASGPRLLSQVPRAVTTEDVAAPLIVIMAVPLKAAPDMASANIARFAIGDRVQQTGIVHGPVEFVRVRTASGQVGYLLEGQVGAAPTPRPPVQAQAAPQAPTAVVAPPAPLQPAPIQTPPTPTPVAAPVVVQIPPAPAVVQAPPPPAPAVVQAVPTPAAPAVTVPAPAPAPVISAAPLPVAPPAPSPKPKVKTDL